MVLCVALAACRREPSGNLVLISLDTLSARTLYSALDADALPNLGAFAQEGVRFETAHSTASWTLPAHASMMTGLYPDRHGAIHVQAMLRSEVPTLAENLSASGFDTVAFTDGGAVHHRFGLNRGFDRYDEWSRAGTASATTLPRQGAPDPLRGRDPFDRAIAFLEADERERPLFLFLHTYTMHDYFNLNPWNLGALDRDGLLSPEAYVRCVLGVRRCGPDDWAVLERLYRSGLDHLDAAFGRLVQALDRADLLRTSWIVVVSDHGEGFDPERRRIHHGGRLHSDLVTVPLLVRPPGGASPRVRAAAVSLVDLLPTFLTVVGIQVPTGLDGRSFAPLLAGDETASMRTRPHYAMEHAFRWRGGKRRRVRNIPERPLAAAVIDDNLWFIRSRRSEEVYAVGNDPEQSQPVRLAVEQLEPMRKLLAQRERLRQSPQARPEDEKLEAELRALGYIQ